MSSDGDDVSDDDAKSLLSPSAYLRAPSSSQTVLEQSRLDQSEGQARPTTDEDTYGDDSGSEGNRENRFAGPASTWRGYTADERALAASLDQERANYLSIHLYNAHALKFRLYDAETANEAKPWHSKQHWMARGEDGRLPWHPDQHWTAWPLPAQNVPRKDERFGQDPTQNADDQGTFLKAEAWRPGADLSEELQAMMLRAAKEKLKRRSFAPAGHVGTARAQASQPTSRPTSAASSRRNSNADSTVSIEVDWKLDKDPAIHSLTPTILTDDDQARRLLASQTNHVLSKLDDLLMGLHKSRLAAMSSNTARSDSEADHRLQKRKRASTGDTGADDGSVKAKKDPHRDYTKHPSGPHPAGTRDWSEVLGMAALTGWDQSVVDRASRRCAALFGESVSMRTMPETTVAASADRVVEYTPSQILDIDMSDGSEDEDLGVAEAEALCCPEESCPRWHHPFEQRWRLREHLKKAHDYTSEDLDAIDRRGKRPSSDDVEPETETPDSEEAANDDGAVHLDGFLQPIELSFGRGKDLAVRKAKRKKGDTGSLPGVGGDAVAGGEP